MSAHAATIHGICCHQFMQKVCPTRHPNSREAPYRSKCTQSRIYPGVNVADARKSTAEKLIAFRKELDAEGVFRPEHIEHLVNKAAESLLTVGYDGAYSLLVVK